MLTGPPPGKTFRNGQKLRIGARGRASPRCAVGPAPRYPQLVWSLTALRCLQTRLWCRLDGFRDEIELRRGYKEDIWDVRLGPPTPIVPRRRRLGVPERVDLTRAGRGKRYAITLLG